MSIFLEAGIVCSEVSLSSLLLGLVDPPHVNSVSLWLSMFVTMTASLSGLKPFCLDPSIDPSGIGRELLFAPRRPELGNPEGYLESFREPSHFRSKGRSVARLPAVIPRPASMLDQMAIW